jgi:hypothetical protein
LTFIDFEKGLSRRNSGFVAALLGLLGAVGYHYWQARTIPLYTAVTTVQLESPAALALPGAQRTAPPPEEIRAIRQLLVSKRLRSKVVSSLTPSERSVVLKPALQRRRRGEAPPSVASALGSIEPELVGGSTRIRVRVTHEDPVAAALIANRYADEFQALVSQDPDAIGGPSAEAEAVPVLRLDVARPNYSPSYPDLLRLKRSSLGLALGALGLAAAAFFSLVTALRNAGEMRSI